MGDSFKKPAQLDADGGSDFMAAQVKEPDAENPRDRHETAARRYDLLSVLWK